MFSGVRDREMRGRRATRFIEFASASVKQNYRRTGIFGRYFNVLPADSPAPSGLQSFQRGFFCREARGIMLRGDRPARFAVSALGVGKDTLGKARRAFDGFAHAADFDDVDSD